MGGMYDRLGLFSTLPTVSTVLIGALAGQWLFLETRDALAKVLWLLVAAVVCLAAGHVCAQWFPINTKVWSPPYVLAAGGWSLIFLAVFYMLIDVWRLRRWAFVFVVIGMNSLAIYFAQYPIDFDGIAKFFVSGVMGRTSLAAAALVLASGVLVLKWLVTLFLYRRRIFIRV
jgi:predicted acyltransferase